MSEISETLNTRLTKNKYENWKCGSLSSIHHSITNKITIKITQLWENNFVNNWFYILPYEDIGLRLIKYDLIVPTSL